MGLRTRLGWGLAALLSVGVALYGYHYLAPRSFIPPNIGANPMAHPWLFVHAGFAATALLAGPFQVLPRLRARRPRLRRWIGRTYVAACLIGGSAGLALALGSTAGPIARAGFAALAVVWILCTAMAWRMALHRRFDEHRLWMIRSFALTFAAVTLRIYMPLAAIAGLDPLISYRAISWLCWVPNLIAAQLYLARRPRIAVRPLRAAA